METPSDGSAKNSAAVICNIDSDDSNLSVKSCDNTNIWDLYSDYDFNDEAYYDMSGHWDDDDTNDKPETFVPEPFHNVTDEQSVESMMHEDVAPVAEPLNEDMLEENNNDPNNNIDSIEIDNAGEQQAQVPLNESPRPGCSKDSEPAYFERDISGENDEDDVILDEVCHDDVDGSCDDDEEDEDEEEEEGEEVVCDDNNDANAVTENGSANVNEKNENEGNDDVLEEEETLLERTEQILDLVALINRDSVARALKNAPKRSLKDLTLWDLIPQNERTELRNTKEKKSEIDSQPVAAVSSSKRGPADDICTIGCKKSSSDSNISIISPVIVSEPPITKVPLNSQISSQPGTNQGAIPKVWVKSTKRSQHVKTIQPWIPTERSKPLQAIDHRMPKDSAEILDSAAIPINGAEVIVSNSWRSSRPSQKQSVQRLDSQSPMVVEETQQSVVNRQKVLPPRVFSEPHQHLQSSTLERPENSSLREQLEKQQRDLAKNLRSDMKKQQLLDYMRREQNYCYDRRNRHKQQSEQKQQSQHEKKQHVSGQEKMQWQRGAPIKQQIYIYKNGVLTADNLPLVQQQSQHRTAPPQQQLQQLPQQRQQQQLQQLPYQQQQRISSAQQQQRILSAQQQLQQLPHQQQQGILSAQQQLQQLPHQQQQRISSAQQQSQQQQQRISSAQQQLQQLPQQRQQQQSQQLPQEQPQQQHPPPQTTLQKASEKTVCMDMYYKLRGIFPQINPSYIKSICPSKWEGEDHEAQLAPLIERLLEYDSLESQTADAAAVSVPAEVPVKNEPDRFFNSIDEIYENFLGIFPDADPHYLREFAEKNVGNADAVKNFVELNLEGRSYPTREQYMARLKITEKQKQYTTGFNIQQFLSIIPDPFKHFLDEQRKCAYNTVVFEFLKSHFNRIRVTTISKVYADSNYNLSVTAFGLEKIAPDIKSKRGCFEIPTENVQLLQEIAFIKHKQAIGEYMDRVKKLEQEEFNLLKEKNMLVECQCCYDAECVLSKCSSCENDHLFCNSCIVTGTNAKMGDGETRISCFLNCGSEFSLSTLQRVLAPTIFSILLKKRQAAEVMEAGLEGLVACPFCHFASIPPETDKIFKCLNPECTKESCRLCKELSHVPLKCEEVLKADRAQHYVEEKMTAALARQCYQCKKSYFKEEGCNKINCPCGAMMCYLCDQPIKDYNHFRGQGSDAKDLCPLYSDTIRLDAVAVATVAKQAEMEVLKRNPNIKVDMSKLIPNIPRPAAGPHLDVYNADELARRTRRVFERQL